MWITIAKVLVILAMAALLVTMIVLYAVHERRYRKQMEKDEAEFLCRLAKIKETGSKIPGKQ